MNIVLEKKYGNKEPMSFTVNNKDDFLWALGNMWDAMKEQIEEETPKDADAFWKDLLSKTVFDTKEEFIEWMDMMKKYGLQVQKFDWLDFRKEVVNDFIAEKTDYTDFEDMNDTMDNYEEAIKNIREAICYL